MWPRGCTHRWPSLSRTSARPGCAGGFFSPRPPPHLVPPLRLSPATPRLTPPAPLPPHTFLHRPGRRQEHLQPDRPPLGDRPGEPRRRDARQVRGQHRVPGGWVPLPEPAAGAGAEGLLAGNSGAEDHRARREQRRGQVHHDPDPPAVLCAQQALASRRLRLRSGGLARPRIADSPPLSSPPL